METGTGPRYQRVRTVSITWAPALFIVSRSSFSAPWDARGDSDASSVSIQAVIDLAIESKKKSNRRPAYIKSLHWFLTRFAAASEHVPIHEFTVAYIEKWLDPFRGYYRQTWLSRLSTLFSFAQRRGYIKENPCDLIDRVTVDRKPPVILSPEQAELLLKTTPATCRPRLILGLYAGIRPDEITLLHWSDVDLNTKTVRVNITKTHRRRIVPLEPKAIALLSACPLKTGPISASASCVRRWKRKARAILGFKTWPSDLLRHTAASYLLALHGDAQKVSTRLGNSTAIMLTHYHEPVPAEACQRFWSVV